MSQTTSKFRLYVLTGSIAAITATGAWYGAGLKTRQEFHTERKQILEATIPGKITQLEHTKSKLWKERTELAAKIERLTNDSTSTSSSPLGN